MTNTVADQTTLARAYVEDGYAVVPGLLDAEELDELKTDIVRLARGAYPCDGIAPVPDDLPDDEVLRQVLAIHFPHAVSPVMLRYLQHPALAEVLAQVTGAHLPHWDGRVKGFQSMVFVKPPGFPGQAWHQDEVFIPTRDRSLVGAWVAIDDATVANGCLWVLPGSHRNGYLYPLKEHGRPEEFDTAPESYGFDDSEEIPVELEAGSVLFFNGYLLHRSKPNRSEGFRRDLRRPLPERLVAPSLEAADEARGSLDGGDRLPPRRAGRGPGSVRLEGLRERPERGVHPPS